MNFTNLTYKDVDIILGFNLTFCIGPPYWSRKSGLSSKKRARMDRTAAYLIKRFIVPLRKYKLSSPTNARASASALDCTYNIYLSKKRIKLIAEVLQIGVEISKEDNYYDLQVITGYEINEIKEFFEKFKSTINKGRL
ncbi:MAG: hypothetical protein J6K25_09735 [Thermoguttaceae bacterium]|nr:hypothetical protein [Thermoguttaceae bacterium]